MNLTQGLHRSVQQRPDAVATVFAGRTRTHRESVDRIARLAAGLRGSASATARESRSCSSTPTAITSSSPRLCGRAVSSSR